MGSALLIGVVVLGGAGAFWTGLQAFRAQAKDRQAEEARRSEGVGEESMLQELSAVASLVSGGVNVGRVTRVMQDEGAVLEVLVTLPPLDSQVYEYHVWLVKEGLADVVDLGALTARADGTWTGVFVASPATGIIDPMLFSRVVIMLEPRDGNPAPSGNKIVEGYW